MWAERVTSLEAGAARVAASALGGPEQRPATVDPTAIARVTVAEHVERKRRMDLETLGVPLRFDMCPVVVAVAALGPRPYARRP
jgi:hypothetical protein